MRISAYNALDTWIKREPPASFAAINLSSEGQSVRLRIPRVLEVYGPTLLTARAIGALIQINRSKVEVANAPCDHIALTKLNSILAQGAGLYGEPLPYARRVA